MMPIPQPQVIELSEEIPPEFTRSAFADLFERPAVHAQHPGALQAPLANERLVVAPAARR